MLIEDNSTLVVDINNLNNSVNQIQSENSECAHCGLPCNEQKIVENKLSFCCSGCAAVYSLLNDSNLCRYYEEGKGLPSEQTEDNSLNYLNDSETADKFIVFSEGSELQYKFRIPGMHCNSCIYLLERLDRLHPNVISSRVDFFNKELVVHAKKGDSVLSSLVQLLYKLGYKPDLSLANNSDKKTNKWSSRTIKIGIAGFCFGNIMMLSFPDYLGLSIDNSSVHLKKWFDYLSLFLSLPVLFYCSTEFFESSYKAIRSKTLNIDLPITLALVATFLRSLYEMFVMGGSGYFDSMTGIVFLLLTGRYFQDLTYSSLSFDRDYRSYFPLAARKIENDNNTVVNISKLLKDDLIELRNAELLPADAISQNSTITIDYSFITGESKPVVVNAGDKVYAGAILNGQSAQFKLLDSTDNSRLVKLWSVERNTQIKDNSLTEKINYYFTLGLLLVGAFAFVYQYYINGSVEAFKALTSVLIVACPCILLLATTFANGHLLRTLKNNGMFVKNRHIISVLEKCNAIVFDKTGTLTDNKAFEISNSTLLNEDELNKVASICHQSVHPYSMAISKNYFKINYKLEAYNDIPGKGLQARINGDLYRIGSAKFIGIDINSDIPNGGVLHIEINGLYKGFFLLKHCLRNVSNQIVSRFNQQGYSMYLSSGDSELNADINTHNFKQILLKQEPESKAAFVKHLKSQGKIVCMAGDGLNDAPAMQEADVAVSVADNENAFFPACDVLLTSNALGKMPDLMQMIRAAKWVIIVSFVFSLFYNVFGLYFAVTAQLSPLKAAILMPSSSITMLLITWAMTAILSYKYLHLSK